MVVTNAEKIQNYLPFTSRIGGGKYRDVFKLDNYALKLLKPFVRKDYGPFHIDFPTELYTKYKYGIEDFNQFEYEKYKEFIERVPDELRDRFSKIHIADSIDGVSFSLSDLIRNYDGSLSKSLSQYKCIPDSGFWKKIDELEDLLVSGDVPILDIRGQNIMVKETDDGMVPVMIDFKRFGKRTYRAQFWLSSEKKLFDKLHRRFQRLKEKYKGYSGSQVPLCPTV